MKIEKRERSSVLAVLGLFACTALSFGETIEQPVVLTIDFENVVLYRGDVTDSAKLARDTGVTAPLPGRAFQVSYNAGDIVAVNGKPAKGFFTSMQGNVTSAVIPQPGLQIGDLSSSSPILGHNQFLGPDGAWIGSMTIYGGTSAAPASSGTVIAGSGAWLGITGENRLLELMVPPRTASVTEDPANRRINGGGKYRFTFFLYPKTRPSVVESIDGPAIFHGDFTPVTVRSPAKAGETLIVQARSLGPTRPDMLPQGSHLFKADPPEVVNSQVEVTVNGTSATVMKQIGWPGTSELYRLEFQMPEVSPGSATIQITAAWIPGPEVQIAVQ